MKLFGVTFTFNESAVIPYIMPYYENLGYDKLIVYDNLSTDNTVELLKEYSFIEVREYNTGGKLDSDRISLIKSNAFYEFKNSYENESVWMTISDLDKVIYFENIENYNSFKEFLLIKENDGYCYYDKQMIEPLSENFPILDNTRYVHKKFHLEEFLIKIIGLK